MPRGLQAEDIKREAQAQLPTVLAALGVRAPMTGSYISMCNPVVKDRHPSFTIWTRGPAAGAWRDERNRGKGGDQGDIIDLVSYLNGWWTRPNRGFQEAIRWLTDTLNLAGIDRAQLERDRARSRRDQLHAQKIADDELAEKRARAFELFTKAAPLKGTLADLYLRTRGIDLHELALGPRGGMRWPHAIRFLAQAQHSESGQVLPAMVAACTDTQTRRIGAVHRTWLRTDGRGKADVRPVKKVWPSYAGLVIPIWRGDTNMNVRQAIEAGVRETLVLTEGIEDALSAVLAKPAFRTWTFIALGNLSAITLPEIIDGVILHRQEEWQNRAAVKAFERGVAALRLQGVPVIEGKAFSGKDWNDTLRGANGEVT